MSELGVSRPRVWWRRPLMSAGPASSICEPRWVISVGLRIDRARVSALRQLVLDVPAPVVAAALGFTHFTTHRHGAAAGGLWNRYAASGTTRDNGP